MVLFTLSRLDERIVKSTNFAENGKGLTCVREIDCLLFSDERPDMD